MTYYRAFLATYLIATLALSTAAIQAQAKNTEPHPINSQQQKQTTQLKIASPDSLMIQDWIVYQISITQIAQEHNQFMQEVLANGMNTQQTQQLILMKKMLKQPLVARKQLQQLKLSHPDLKKLLQLHIDKLNIELALLKLDYGSEGFSKEDFAEIARLYPELANDPDQLAQLRMMDHHNLDDFSDYTDSINSAITQYMLQHPVSKASDQASILINEWFRYQQTMQEIEQLHHALDHNPSHYLFGGDETLKKFKQQLEQFQPTSVQKLNSIQAQNADMKALIEQRKVWVSSVDARLRYDLSTAGFEDVYPEQHQSDGEDQDGGESNEKDALQQELKQQQLEALDLKVKLQVLQNMQTLKIAVP